MLRARAYTRVSTQEQVEEGVSLETQLTDIRNYCLAQKMEIIKEYSDDGKSGADMTRPHFVELLQEIQPGEYLIVWKLSRFARKVSAAITIVEDLTNRGIYFVSVREKIDLSTPMGKAMFQMMMVFYELERNTTIDNIKKNMERLSKQGKLRGRPNFGWRFIEKDQDLEPIPEQQEVINIIKQMYTDSSNFSQIANYLNEKGYAKVLLLNRTKERKKEPQFYPQTVKNILIDHGFIEDDSEKKRVPLQQRLTSYHKKSDRKFDNNKISTKPVSQPN